MIPHDRGDLDRPALDLSVTTAVRAFHRSIDDRADEHIVHNEQVANLYRGSRRAFDVESRQRLLLRRFGPFPIWPNGTTHSMGPYERTARECDGQNECSKNVFHYLLPKCCKAGMVRKKLLASEDAKNYHGNDVYYYTDNGRRPDKSFSAEIRLLAFQRRRGKIPHLDMRINALRQTNSRQTFSFSAVLAGTAIAE